MNTSDIEIIDYQFSPNVIDQIITCLIKKKSFFIIKKSWPEPFKKSLISLVRSKIQSETCYMVSSGTTGTPKIYLHPIQNIFKSVERSLKHNPIYDSILLSLSPVHMGGLLTIAKSIVSNSKIILLNNGNWTDAFKENPTHLVLVPAQLSKIISNIPKSIKSILIGGDSTPLYLKKRAAHLPIIYSYGCTETCGQITGTPIGTFSQDSGEPLDGVALKIKASRLLIQTDTLASGYITGSGFSEITGPYLSQDIATLNNRNALHIIGRADHQFNSGGELISPEYIESIILKHPNVNHVFIYPVPHLKFQLVPIAIIHGSVDFNTLQIWCKKQLPVSMQPHALIPWPTDIPYEGKCTRRTLLKNTRFFSTQDLKW